MQLEMGERQERQWSRIVTDAQPTCFINFKKKVFIYLKVREKGREREIEQIDR